MSSFHSNELFEQIRERVTMEQVLERYGFTTKKHLCICPFHNDTKPSMRVYQNSFYCFSCCTGGDVVKFVALYFDIGNYKAAKIIANEFGIQTSDSIDYVSLKRKKNEYEKKRRFLEWIDNARSMLADYHRELYKNMEQIRPKSTEDELTDEFIRCFNEIEDLCYLLDELDTDDMNRLIRFYNSDKKEVEQIERRIADTRCDGEKRVG